MMLYYPQYSQYPQSVSDVRVKADNISGSIQAKLHQWKNIWKNFTAQALTKEVHKTSVPEGLKAKM